MHNGYYLEKADLEEGLEDDVSFEFMEMEDCRKKFEGMTIHPYDFLHGHCDAFARYISSKYGFKIEAIYDKGNLVHAYCICQKNGKELFIDVRGITDDYEEFITEFDDFLKYEGKPSRYTIRQTYDLENELREEPRDLYEQAEEIVCFNGYYDPNGFPV